MAKVVMTFTDNPDGSVHMDTEFDPPAERDNWTPAQQTAILISSAIESTKGAEVLSEEGED